MLFEEEFIVPGFRSSEVFATLRATLNSLSEEEKYEMARQVNGIFEFYVMTNEGKTETFTINLKKNSDYDISIIKGRGCKNPNVVISIRDVDLVDLAKGKINGQKAFTSGKIRVKGEMSLATKLDKVFKQLSGRRARL